jgi:gliding motility-associated-like protein
VNAITNTAYYVANNGTNFVFDGYTVVLTAIAPVIPCSTYTIKLAIADVGDTAFDSAVFLEENSFGTGAVTISPSYNYNSAINDTLIYEGCSDVTITFFRDGVIGQADTVPVQISGSATNGVDYQYNGGPVPNQIIFAPGQASFDLTLTPIQDGVNEPSENVTFTVTNVNACGNVYTSTISLTITNVNPLDINGGPDRQICPNVPQIFNGVITGGVPPYTSIWTQNGTPVGSNPLNITPGGNATYIVTVTDGCTGSLAADTVNVTVGPPQFTINEAIDSSACFGTDDGSIIIVVTGQTPPFSYLWTPGNLTTQNLSGLAPGTYTLQVTDTFGCQITETYQVYEPANIPLNFSDRFICSGDSVNVNPNALPNTNYSWTPSQYFFGPDQNTPTLSANNPGPEVDTLFIDVVATAPGACGQDNFRVFVTPLPQVQLLEPGYDSTALCPGDTIPLSNALSNAGYPNVTGTLWSTGSTASNINATATGTYWLELTNNAGCKLRDSLEIYPVAPPNASIDTAFYICGSQPVTLFGTNYDPATDDLLWSTGETTETISVNTDGIYYFYVSNYCATDTNMTKVIEIPTVELTDLPNIITPNGDNINDTYSVLDLFTYSIKFNVKIYNRWGAKVFETEDKDINWNPKNISDGVYFMTILYLDCSNEEKKLAQTITVSSGK